MADNLLDHGGEGPPALIDRDRAKGAWHTAPSQDGHF